MHTYGERGAGRGVVVLGNGSKPTVIHVPACPSVQPLRAAAVGQRFAATIAGWEPSSWHRVSSSSSVMQDASLNNGSLAARLAPSRGYVVVRFKAPTFAATYNGGAISGHEQVRYWSICAYDGHTGRLSGCVADYQSSLDKSGDATIVLGDPTRRPAASTLAHANWLPLGSTGQSVLIYRQLLPAPGFSQAVQRASGSEKQMRARMGAYFPTIVTCDAAHWAENRCVS